MSREQTAAKQRILFSRGQHDGTSGRKWPLNLLKDEQDSDGE